MALQQGLGGETAAIMEQYNQRLYKLNEAVTLRNGDTVFPLPYGRYRRRPAYYLRYGRANV